MDRSKSKVTVEEERGNGGGISLGGGRSGTEDIRDHRRVCHDRG